MCDVIRYVCSGSKKTVFINFKELSKKACLCVYVCGFMCSCVCVRVYVFVCMFMCVYVFACVCVT